MGSSPSSPSRSESDCWSNKIWFAPDADTANPDIEPYSDNELKTDLASRIKASEEILNISIWKCDLSSWQLTNLYLFHAYVVLETNDYWWSIEKNDEGITIQRAKRNGNVIKWYR